MLTSTFCRYSAYVPPVSIDGLSANDAHRVFSHFLHLMGRRQFFHFTVAFLVGHLFFRGQVVRNRSILQGNRIVVIFAQTNRQRSYKHWSLVQKNSQHDLTDP